MGFFFVFEGVFCGHCFLPKVKCLLHYNWGFSNRLAVVTCVRVSLQTYYRGLSDGVTTPRKIVIQLPTQYAAHVKPVPNVTAMV